MKKTTLWIVALLSIATLAGCNKSLNVENEQERIFSCWNVVGEYFGAKDYSVSWDREEEAWASFVLNWKVNLWNEMDGTLEKKDVQCIVDMVDKSVTIQEIEEGNVEDNTEENIDTVLPENAKTSLTDEELEEIIDTHFPKGYTYSVYNTKTEESNEGEYTYPEDLSHTLLIPIHATMASREVTSSWIEDGMIYTLTKVVLQDDTEVSVLYIVNPETLDLVAANVENGNETTNYQFVY